MDVSIRLAKAEDCKAICALIKELAEYEGCLDQPTSGETMLIEDGFGELPFYYCLVAEVPDNDGSKLIVGYCLYYFTYASRRGRGIYMEELYVKKDHRRKGIGLKLCRTLAQEAVANKCKRMEFDVLNWNQNSIKFYEKCGAKRQTRQNDWNFFHLDQESLERFAKDKTDPADAE